MIEEIKSMLDWIAGKDIWYWITIAVAVGVARTFSTTLFGPMWASIKRWASKRSRKSKKTEPKKPEGRWARYE